MAQQQAVNPGDLFYDQGFLNLPEDQQIQKLGQVVPEFSKAKPEVQREAVRLSKQRASKVSTGIPTSPPPAMKEDAFTATPTPQPRVGPLPGPPPASPTFTGLGAHAPTPWDYDLKSTADQAQIATATETAKQAPMITKRMETEEALRAKKQEAFDKIPVLYEKLQKETDPRVRAQIEGEISILNAVATGTAISRYALGGYGAGRTVPIHIQESAIRHGYDPNTPWEWRSEEEKDEIQQDFVTEAQQKDEITKARLKAIKDRINRATGGGVNWTKAGSELRARTASITREITMWQAKQRMNSADTSKLNRFVENETIQREHLDPLMEEYKKIAVDIEEKTAGKKKAPTGSPPPPPGTTAGKNPLQGLIDQINQAAPR
jgi:hypothetical protein